MRLRMEAAIRLDGCIGRTPARDRSEAEGERRESGTAVCGRMRHAPAHSFYGKDKAMTLNIIFPVLNEHLRLRAGVTRTIRYMEHYCEKYGRLPYRCTIVDNGSDDDTPQIGRALEQEHPGTVRYLRLEERGVGIAFRTGVEQNDCDIVGTMDIDLSTEIKNLGRTIQLFEKNPGLEYVNATRFHKGSETVGRKWYRKITSAGLVFLLKTEFRMKASDAICGFTFMKADVARRLTAQCSEDNGWFYMIELLLRAERDGVKIYDMPVRFTEDYNTTVNVPGTVRNYLERMHELKKRFREEDREERQRRLDEKRYQEICSRETELWREEQPEAADSSETDIPARSTEKEATGQPEDETTRAGQE